MMQESATLRKKYTKPQEYPLAALPVFENPPEEGKQEDEDQPDGAAQQ